MPGLAVDAEDGVEVTLYYEDVGSGRPVLLVPGWPLSQRAWDQQVRPFVAAGRRVVSYDRRGSGRSTHSWTGYDYDTFAADLAGLLDRLDLRDVALVGFSSGCGDIARYIRRYGTDRIAELVFLSAPPVCSDAPDRFAASDLVDTLVVASIQHRIPMLDEVLRRFFSVDGVLTVDEPTRQFHLRQAASASAKATTDSIAASGSVDFARDLAGVDRPTLVVHGAGDAVAPFAESGRRIAAAVPGSQVVLIPDAPHAAPITHFEQCNAAVLEFLGAGPAA
ncbi:alpha/beta hydrolase [Micromonospora sp. NPDC051296]|uniref:alpha/beta fold hydrolase n=1 Tax=Micromonospora sp. NPDC051296 TaxID=3155046 RepID=UPI00343B8577